MTVDMRDGVTVPAKTHCVDGFMCLLMVQLRNVDAVKQHCLWPMSSIPELQWSGLVWCSGAAVHRAGACDALHSFSDRYLSVGCADSPSDILWTLTPS